VSPGVQPLSSSATMPAVTSIWGLMQLSLALVPETDPNYAAALSAAGINFNFDSKDYAWYVQGVDANSDGVVDNHPILNPAGTNPLKWQYPVVLLQRARTQVEIQAGLPQVMFIGALDPVQTATKTVFTSPIRILIPPVALVTLSESDPSCRVSYLPPGNLAALYANAGDCQELPTGRYTINVLAGNAGGALVPNPDTTVSDNGYQISATAPGTYSSQTWTIPNELGPADTNYNPLAQDQLDASLLLEAQGPKARLAVVENTPDNGVRHDCTTPVKGVTAACCAAVQHLCGIPVCDVVLDADGYSIREARTLGPDGNPTCVPFMMPASCCP
jgi:hypothetical protein